MKLGELKIASLMLVAPSLEINLDSSDEKSLEEKIMELKANPNVLDYLNGLVYSINRAFSIVEKQGFVKEKRKALNKDELEKTSYGYRLSLDKISKDILEIKKIYQKEPCRFEFDGDNTIILKSVKNEPIEIVYTERLKRINEATSDLYELEIDFAIAEIIPYFVKSELILSDDPDEAEVSKNHFFELLKMMSSPKLVHNEMVVDSVYRMW
ncbi:MAG: hypothetical protein IJD42_07755 [Clostridia bacterium]|nr:hypothetical protein [Clostridia bacterium]